MSWHLIFVDIKRLIVFVEVFLIGCSGTKKNVTVIISESDNISGQEVQGAKSFYYTAFQKLITQPLPQRKGTVIFAVDEYNRIIPDSDFKVDSKSVVAIKKTDESGVYAIILPDNTHIYDLQVVFSAPGFISQKRRFMVADQTTLCVRAGKGEDLYLSFNSSLYPIKSYSEFLLLSGKNEKEVQGAIFHESSKETHQKISQFINEFQLSDKVPFRAEMDIKSNSKLLGIVVPKEIALRKKVLDALKKDNELVPYTLCFLWDETEPNNLYGIRGKMVTFAFPESTADEHIRIVLKKYDFLTDEIIPPSHRLNALPEKLVHAHYLDILSLDLIRKASGVVTEGEAYNYTLNQIGHVETTRDH